MDMMKKMKFIAIFLCGLALSSGGCSLISPPPPNHAQAVLYLPANDDTNPVNLYAPLFLIEENQQDYNRIGTPSLRVDTAGNPERYIDTGQATIYTMTQEFQTTSGTYTNLIYRVHFPLTPLPHLTAGKNVGLLVYITLNSEQEVILITTLHTCGCFLGFIPTLQLPEKSWPRGWDKSGQSVFGEKLPGLLQKTGADQRLILDLRSETHRVRRARYADRKDYSNYAQIPMQMKAMAELDHLPAPDGQALSFFATEGVRKGLVIGSNKPLEMIFMGLLALDPFVGEDKALGPPEKTGTRLYTSLKFWARDSSNIWFFERFLRYWGWKL